MRQAAYNVISGSSVNIKAFTKGVEVCPNTIQQLKNIASLNFLHSHVACMPDAHLGKGATVGTVIATKRAVIPAAVGVDIGCGMCAVQTTLSASDLPDSLRDIRRAIESNIPVGFHEYREAAPETRAIWGDLEEGFDWLEYKVPKLITGKELQQVGTLGGGNHFIEMCLDEDQKVWIMLHSGSRGIGNRIGTHFIQVAKKDMGVHLKNLPDKELAYLSEGTEHFDDYIKALMWAQNYASKNRQVMMKRVLSTLRLCQLPDFSVTKKAVNCHHNYVQQEEHFGENCYVTRKGAVSARQGELGIIPGSMGAKSFIVEGLGNPDSFHSCSHGAGRLMSRTEAKKHFTVSDHALATKGVECRKDEGVIDETPAAYKNIDDVMAAQNTLVKIVHILKQVLCVKG